MDHPFGMPPVALPAGSNDDALPARVGTSPCRSAGDLYFDHPDEPAKEAARLGDFPFTTTVTLTLDGHTYRATAVYPDDEIKGNEPSVALRFTPELPGL